MAVGPLARIIAQVIVPAIAVLVRALPAAYAQALGNAKKGGVTAAQAVTRKAMSKEEALQILNLHQEEKLTAEAIQKVRGCDALSSLAKLPCIIL
jgi:import inner membrane translocase subunit TIM16